MKYVNQVSVVMALLFLAGCQSEAMFSPGGGSSESSQPVSDTTVASCTVTPATGGVNLSCPNGTSTFVPNGPQGDKGSTGATGASGSNGTAGTNGTTGSNGSNGSVGATGATGAAGALGATGATSRFALRNGDGNLVGTYLLSYLPVHSGPAITVWDDTTQSTIAWSYNGQPWSETLYFTGASCTGTPYAHKAMAQGLVFASGGSWYKVTNTTVTGYVMNSSLSGGTCTNGSLASDTYSAISAYSNASIPVTLTLPVRIEKQ